MEYGSHGLEKYMIHKVER